jgi:hypothetical protein
MLNPDGTLPSQPVKTVTETIYLGKLTVAFKKVKNDKKWWQFWIPNYRYEECVPDKIHDKN